MVSRLSDLYQAIEIQCTAYSEILSLIPKFLPEEPQTLSGEEGFGFLMASLGMQLTILAIRFLEILGGGSFSPFGWL